MTKAKFTMLLWFATASLIESRDPRSALGQAATPLEPTKRAQASCRGIPMMSPGRQGLPLLKRAIAEKLAPMGVNVLILEINYGFAFRSHPELASGENALRVEDARDLAETC